MFGLGPLEMVIILAAALVFIGPGKLPEVARSLGKGMREMRRAVAGFEGEIQKATSPVEDRETRTPPQHETESEPDPDSHAGLFPPDDPRSAQEDAPAKDDTGEAAEEEEPGPPDRVPQVQARPVRPADDTSDEDASAPTAESDPTPDEPGAEVLPENTESV
ncbi:MAG: twin-arginine translocase TatA/TatE family subunit [Myxococcota bacterium]|nr:twin-arginine translocase TatA/TatE family subunit [Myxococcota bacterium]